MANFQVDWSQAFGKEGVKPPLSSYTLHEIKEIFHTGNISTQAHYSTHLFILNPKPNAGVRAAWLDHRPLVLVTFTSYSADGGEQSASKASLLGRILCACLRVRVCALILADLVYEDLVQEEDGLCLRGPEALTLNPKILDPINPETPPLLPPTSPLRAHIHSPSSPFEGPYSLPKLPF